MKYYDIRQSETAVELWSGSRMQFGGMERQPWQRDAKSEMKAALARLLISPQTVLCGYYDSTEPRLADTENSLFTNFVDEMPKGVRSLRFEQGPSCPPSPTTPIELVEGHLHYYRYELNREWRTWEADQTLARWNRVPRRIADDGSARPAWFAMREASSTKQVGLTGHHFAPNSNFGLRIIVHATPRGPANAISVSEKVVDGIIAAFHDDRFSKGLADAMAPKLPKVTVEELAVALDSMIGPLFDTPAITYSDAGFVQISPADERCRAGELMICNDSTSECPELSGELFTIRPANTTSIL